MKRENPASLYKNKLDSVKLSKVNYTTLPDIDAMARDFLRVAQYANGHTEQGGVDAFSRAKEALFEHMPWISAYDGVFVNLTQDYNDLNALTSVPDSYKKGIMDSVYTLLQLIGPFLNDKSLISNFSDIQKGAYQKSFDNIKSSFQSATNSAPTPTNGYSTTAPSFRPASLVKNIIIAQAAPPVASTQPTGTPKPTTQTTPSKPQLSTEQRNALNHEIDKISDVVKRIRNNAGNFEKSDVLKKYNFNFNSFEVALSYLEKLSNMNPDQRIKAIEDQVAVQSSASEQISTSGQDALFGGPNGKIQKYRLDQEIKPISQTALVNSPSTIQNILKSSAATKTPWTQVAPQIQAAWKAINKQDITDEMLVQFMNFYLQLTKQSPQNTATTPVSNTPQNNVAPVTSPKPAL
jgi:DNA-directed RNA polymerase subunit F